MNFYDRQRVRTASTEPDTISIGRALEAPPARPVAASRLADAVPFFDAYPAFRAGSFRPVDVPGGGAS